MLLRTVPLSRTSSGSVVAGGRTIAYRVVRSSRRRRTMQISLRAEDGVIVRVPLRMPEAQVRSFVEERADWIVNRLLELSAASPRRPLVMGAALPFLGEWLRLELHEDAGPTVDATNGALAVGCPSPGSEPLLRAVLTRWYAERASDVIRTTVARWAIVTGLEPRRVLVKDQRRRWGSCGADGTLRFNWRLVMAEPALIDLVVVHELAHLKHRNHSPAFWAEVARHIPDLVARRRRLRGIGPTLVL
jgi:predicted metal-dependent hydrolase